MSSEVSGVYEVVPLGERWTIQWNGEPLLVVNDLLTAIGLVAGAQRAFARPRPRGESTSFASADEGVPARSPRRN